MTVGFSSETAAPGEGDWWCSEHRIPPIDGRYELPGDGQPHHEACLLKTRQSRLICLEA